MQNDRPSLWVIYSVHMYVQTQNESHRSQLCTVFRRQNCNLYTYIIIYVMWSEEFRLHSQDYSKETQYRSIKCQKTQDVGRKDAMMRWCNPCHDVSGGPNSNHVEVMKSPLVPTACRFELPHRFQRWHGWVTAKVVIRCHSFIHVFHVIPFSSWHLESGPWVTSWYPIAPVICAACAVLSTNNRFHHHALLVGRCWDSFQPCLKILKPTLWLKKNIHLALAIWHIFWVDPYPARLVVNQPWPLDGAGRVCKKKGWRIWEVGHNVRKGLSIITVIELMYIVVLHQHHRFHCTVTYRNYVLLFVTGIMMLLIYLI